MYAKIKSPYALRGYQGIPYVLVNLDSGYCDFLNQKGFQALHFCDGTIDLDMVLMDAEQKEFIYEGVQAGVIELTEEPSSLEEVQYYKKANNKYIRSVHWSITGRCNLKCRHCYMSAPDYKFHDLSTEECFGIIEQFREANVATISITGGEPFVRKDIFTLMDKIYQEGMGISQIYTNGILLSEEILEWFHQRKKNPQFVLSFDCVDCHDWMRGVENTEKLTAAAIKILKEHGFVVMIETAVCERNLHQLEKTYEFLRDLKIDYWKTSLVFKAGKWATNAEGHVEVEELYQEYLKVIERYADDKAPFFIQLDGFFAGKKGEVDVYEFPYVHKCDKKTADKVSSCLNCRIHPYLLPDGTLLPCASMTDSEVQTKMPNLKNCTVSEIYRDINNPFFSLTEIRISHVLACNEKCRVCKYCYECGGGCRAMSLFAGNGLMGYSPTLCVFFENGYREKIRKIMQKRCRKKEYETI